jgi:hypothetical protein
MALGHRFSPAATIVVLLSIICTASGSRIIGDEGGRRKLAVRFNTPKPLPLHQANALTEIEQAYLDSYVILKDEGPCSQFFGGPQAIVALNQLTEQIRPTHLGRVLGLRMSGSTMIVQSYKTGFSYRVFEKVEANLDGPFYRSAGLPSHSSVPGIGGFSPNTREVRATILLHELGHLIRKPGGEWLLPNDGDSLAKSEANTDRILDVCGDQIRSLHRFSFSEELTGIQESIAQAATPTSRSD